jgi:hypothetical protein
LGEFLPLTLLENRKHGRSLTSYLFLFLKECELIKYMGKIHAFFRSGLAKFNQSRIQMISQDSWDPVLSESPTFLQ